MGCRYGSKMALYFSVVVILVVLNLSLITGQTISFDFVEEIAPQSARLKDDTVRPDPLNRLKKYRGGYEIRDVHYWSSTLYTGITGYVLAVLWLLCGLVYGMSLVLTRLCCKRNDGMMKKKRLRCFRRFYSWPVPFALFFTILAVIASALVLGGDTKFHSRAKSVVDILIDTADEASVTIYNTTGAMKVMSVNLDSDYGGTNKDSDFLNSTSERLNSQAADIERVARENRQKIDLGLKVVYIVTTTVISFNLVAAIVLSVVGVLKLKRALYMLIILCWLLSIFCWLFFGLYFFIEQFAGDTCTALESFQENPYNNTLSSILPCDELILTQTVLKDVRADVYNLVNQVNANLSGSQEDSFVQICNPFSPPPYYTYQPEKCPTTAIQIGDIPTVLRLIICSDSDDNNGVCTGGIYISKSKFRKLESYTSSMQNLLNQYPNMDSLVQCQTVKVAFSEILQRHCNPLKGDIKMVWGGMVFLSIVMVVLVMLWTMEARLARRSHLSDSSVNPHFASTEMMASKPVEQIENGLDPSSVV